MKLALILALDQSRKSGLVLDGPIGYNEASDRFKSLVAGGSSTVPDRPVLELWTSSGRTKSTRLGAPAPAEVIIDTPPVVAEVVADAAPADAPLRGRRK